MSITGGVRSLTVALIGLALLPAGAEAKRYFVEAETTVSWEYEPELGDRIVRAHGNASFTKVSAGGGDVKSKLARKARGACYRQVADGFDGREPEVFGYDGYSNDVKAGWSEVKGDGSWESVIYLSRGGQPRDVVVGGGFWLNSYQELEPFTDSKFSHDGRKHVATCYAWYGMAEDMPPGPP